MQNFFQETKSYIKKPYHKEYYNFIVNFIEKNKIKNIIDIGCASGFFFKSLPKELNLKCLGFDINIKLIKYAKKINKNKNYKFIKKDLFSRKLKNFKKFSVKHNLINNDLITILGTISTIPDYIHALNRVISLKPKKIIIQTPLNPEELDVKISHRKNSSFQYQSAYRIISIKNILQYFKKKNYKIKLIPYKIKKKFFKDKNNPTRNYHITLNNKKILTNGMGCLIHEYLIIASKKK